LRGNDGSNYASFLRKQESTSVGWPEKGGKGHCSLIGYNEELKTALSECKGRAATYDMKAFWTRAAWLVLLTLLALAAFDLILAASLRRTGWPNQIVDLQSPSILYTKTDYLRKFQGYKVAVLGDSLIYGRSLLEHGDEDWREHNICRLIEEKIRLKITDRPVLVMNLGINGALPADLEKMVQAVLPLNPDLMIIDYNLRSFSADFSPSAEVLSRKWLEDFRLDRQGKVEPNLSGKSRSEKINMFLSALAVNYWTLYRFGDFFQWRILNGQPRDRLLELRNRLNDRLLGRPTEEGPEDDEFSDDLMVLLLKAKKRYSTVNFREDNPQRQALERTLKLLDGHGQKALIFYAKENPDLIFQIIEENRYRRLFADLAGIIEDHANPNPNLVFLPPVDGLESEYFLDQVHIDYEGYRVLAESMDPLLDRLLTKSCAPESRSEKGFCLE